MSSHTVRYSPQSLIVVGFIPSPSHLHSVCLSPPPRPRSVYELSLCALDALEAAEVPAFLQTGSDASQLLSEGAGQPGEESLHLTGVDLGVQTLQVGTDVLDAGSKRVDVQEC